MYFTLSGRIYPITSPHPVMPTLVVKSVSEALHAKLTKIAAAHQRSVEEETIHLLENALAVGSGASGDIEPLPIWRKENLLPEYEEALRSGTLGGGPDSTAIISEMRDER